MSDIRLYNSLSGKKEAFVPEDAENVRMYVCGPTVYDRAHIGNARAVVVYDVLYRLLRHHYGPDHVTYVRNITDVDDKINAAAKANGESIQALTKRVTEWFHSDMAALGCLPPTIEPRATEFVNERGGPKDKKTHMVAMIEQLIANGHAYPVTEGEGKGHVLFDVASYPDYGKLSGRTIEEQKAGARIAVEGYKKNPGDFVLWKPADAEDDPSSIFDSPWGAGRPGWHIECSVMSTNYLGASFDIHGGGADLKFPHHENEIAQSCCANPGSHFAKLWVHNGFVTVNGEKMSKSLGNFTTVNDVLDQGVPGEVIRYVFLKTHYRKPLDWNERAIKEAHQMVSEMQTALFLALWDVEAKTGGLGASRGEVHPDVLASMRDDMNTGSVPALLRKMAEQAKSDARAAADLRATMHFLGMRSFRAENIFLRGEFEAYRESLEKVAAYCAGLYGDASAEDIGALASEKAVPSNIVELAEQRRDAKKAKDFALADQLRAQIQAEGYVVEDTRDGGFELRKA